MRAKRSPPVVSRRHKLTQQRPPVAPQQRADGGRAGAGEGGGGGGARRRGVAARGLAGTQRRTKELSSRPPTTPPNADAADAKTRGDACFRDGKYGAAEECASFLRRVSLPSASLARRAGYARAVSLSPPTDAEGVAELHACVAECARHEGDARRVVEAAGKALALRPTHRGALLRRGVALEGMERFVGAAEDFEALARADPGARVAREGAKRCRAAAAAVAKAGG